MSPSPVWTLWEAIAYHGKEKIEKALDSGVISVYEKNGVEYIFVNPKMEDLNS